MRKFKILVLFAGIAGACALGYGSASAQEQNFSPAGREALKLAMQNEALASAKYKLFAEHARKAGKNELADLLAATSNQEYGHFLRWAAMYRLVGTDFQNLLTAAQDEVNEDADLYTRLAAEAEARGDKTLAESFIAIKAQEEKHEKAITEALKKAAKPD
jgi:rubrerythrin